MSTSSTNGELADSASSSGRNRRIALQTAIARSHAADADVDVEAEGVVPPGDVAEQLVVAAVVRRVDDPLVLPAAPRMRAGCAEREAELARDRCELRAALHDLGRRLGEVGALARADLGLGGDQLADEVRLERRSLRRRLDLLEAVREVERLVVEQGELLFDRNGEVGAVLERRPRGGELLLGRKALFLAHGSRRLRDRREQARGHTCPRPAVDGGGARRGADRQAVGVGQGQQSRELVPELADVSGRERGELAEVLGVGLLEPGGDLGEPAVAGDERWAAARGGLGGDHPERLGEDRRHDGCIRKREQMGEMAVLERAR